MTRIKITDQDDAISGLRMLGNHPHDVVGCGRPCTPTALAHRERAVVVHEEEGGSVSALEARPMHSTPAIELLGRVDSHMRGAVGDQGPARFVVDHAQRNVSIHVAERHILVWQAVRHCVAQHALDILALLEAHEIIPLWRAGRCNQSASSAALAAPSVEQVPPEEVVGQDLDGDGARAVRASPQGRPVLGWLAHLAPLARTAQL
eukprot:CAMPEP_0179086566 /NCGR_PEP_ID=MMETSP0796-20121207/39276_1 /TAXON_ID=73915 /ORGANISM="Pyrodinium bahamense, Strain pbaha01" /LENGTH=204 /DNA_ID=CAMNT_0020784041 /DNA_START=593 /DNA_END=1208 /DNA_ORIENTATION=+